MAADTLPEGDIQAVRVIFMYGTYDFGTNLLTFLQFAGKISA